jgi:hypothetical protein
VDVYCLNDFVNHCFKLPLSGRSGINFNGQRVGAMQTKILAIATADNMIIKAKYFHIKMALGFVPEGSPSKPRDGFCITLGAHFQSVCAITINARRFTMNKEDSIMVIRFHEPIAQLFQVALALQVAFKLIFWIFDN